MTTAVVLGLVVVFGVAWLRFRERREHWHKNHPRLPTSIKRRVDRGT